MRVHRHIQSAPDDAAALGWIYRISTNYCLNLLRDRARAAEPTAPDELPETDGAALSLDLRFVNLDTAQRLITRAPEKLQEVAVLYYLDGLEQEQVAETLGISRRTVINRLQEFIERSRKFIGKEELA